MKLQVREEFLKEFSEDPMLTFAKTPIGILFKDHLNKFDNYLTFIDFKGLLKENIYQTLESIPSPSQSLSSILSYLVVIRLYLLKVTEQPLEETFKYDPLKVYNILDKAIPLIDLSVVSGEFCSNVFFNLDPKSLVKGVAGVSFGTLGFLIGAPLGFASGGMYLLSRPLVRQMVILSTLYTVACYVLKKGY